MTNLVIPPVQHATVRFVADYQMYGDMQGIDWGNLVFGHAKEAGQIEDFKILSSVTGTHGIQFVTFTVDMRTPITEFRDMDEAMEWAKGMLCGLVNDSDVEVRWAGSPEA